ncbi:MAG: extracellular solute-binding protein [Anaerolineae bacterium]|nr:extracellular solute-binding protein [Anaerolineae bacterium]
MKTTRARSLRTIVVLFLLTLLVAGCGRVEVPGEWSKLEEVARGQGFITLYVFKYPDYFRAVAESFEEETGIQVTVISGSAEGTYQKMVAEKEGRGTVDLWLLSAPQVQPAVEGDLLYGPIIERLPNEANIHPFDAQYAEGFEHRGFVVPAWRNQAVFAYDSQLVAEPPASLADLERWVKSHPKRFSYCDPARGGSGQAFVNSALYWLTGKPERYFGHFDQAIVDEEWPRLWAWLRDIGPYVVYAAGNDDGLEKLARGEVWIAATWEEMLLQWRAEGRLPDSVRAYLPAPGLPGGADFLGVPANSAKKAAALLFVNYLLSEESQNTLTSMLGMRPVRTDIPIPEGLAQAMLPREEFERYRLPWPYPGYKREYKARWAEEVAFR